MRRETYVSDVIAELQRKIERKSRIDSWHKLTEELAAV
jgi:hypothetical protein